MKKNLIVLTLVVGCVSLVIYVQIVMSSLRNKDGVYSAAAVNSSVATKVIAAGYERVAGRSIRFLGLPQIDLNAGNATYPCETNIVIDKMVNNVRYPIFAGDELLRHDERLTRYAFDNKDVYWLDFLDCGKIIGADQESFRTIGMQNAVDKNHAYYRYKMIPDADPLTYKVHETLNLGGVEERWGVDKESVFFRGEKVSQLSTLKEMGNSWLKTDKALFYEGLPLEGIDTESFSLFSRDFQIDKNNIYFRGSALEMETLQRSKLSVHILKIRIRSMVSDSMSLNF